MRWLMLMGALMLGACASDLEPTSAELRARWDAQNVYPATYKKDLLAFLRTYLNNPEGVRSASLSPPALKKLGPGDRYIACARYDARRMDGKYAGLKTGAASYVAGKLDRFFDTPPSQVEELCTGAAYAPFPELERLTR